MYNLDSLDKGFYDDLEIVIEPQPLLGIPITSLVREYPDENRVEVIMASNWDTMYDDAIVSIEGASSVLLTGLGLGILAYRILDEVNPDSITIVEEYQGIIDLIGPTINDDRVTIIQADATTWEPEGNYDVAIHDISADVDFNNALLNHYDSYVDNQYLPDYG